MASKQTLTGLLWAAILVLAVQFMPDFAYAHAGHAKHAPDVGAPIQTPVKQATANNFATQPASQTAIASSTSEDQPISVPASTCTGNCCGTGTGCCGAAQVAGSPDSLPAAGNGSKFAPLVFDPSAGIDPDALIRPPKILA